DILELFQRLHNDVKNIHEELTVYINTPSWDHPTICYIDDDDEDRNIAITPILSTEEPDNSLSMGDEHLDTILETESDELIKSSVENLVPIPSESDGIPDNMCDVTFNDNSPPLDISKDQFEDFFESNNDSTSIDDDSFSIDDIEPTNYLIFLKLLSNHYLSDVPALQFLTCLEIGIPKLCGWTLLFSLLENSPILQILTIRKDCKHYASYKSNRPQDFVLYSHLKDPQDIDWMEPEIPPSCLQSHLEIIKITGSFWMKCDTKTMKYLLGNAKVLKDFIITPGGTIGVNGEAAFLKDLQGYASTLSS
nr:hypothetical protein [Tanacetum cinerariifolium]